MTPGWYHRGDTEMAAPSKVFNVLFICDDDTVRAPIAAFLLNTQRSGRFRAHSAGVRPGREMPAEILEVLRAVGALSDRSRPVAVTEFQRAEAPRLDFVFNLTEAGEGCRDVTLPGSPLPGSPLVVPWPISRPDLTSGSHAERSSRLAETVRMIRRRVELFAELPFDKLDRMAMQLQAETVHRRAGDAEPLQAGSDPAEPLN